ncbi:MAG TPA: zinc-ribbon domain-containing protein [Rubrobacter sp.]|nr:zinc-ribbon domain-containing protein [Rubrobacter sp.]
MSERKYCARCGAQVRPGNAFCVSCGAPATPRAEESGPTQYGPVGSAGPPSPFDKLLTQLQQAVGRFREVFSGRVLGRIGGTSVGELS